jgi:hypothetical protein
MDASSDRELFAPLIAQAHADPSALTIDAVNAAGPYESTCLIMVASARRFTTTLPSEVVPKYTPDDIKALVRAKCDVNQEAWEFDDDVDGVHVGEDANRWKKRRTPLMAAAAKGHTDLVGALIELGANVNQGKSTDGATPLFMVPLPLIHTCATIIITAAAATTNCHLYQHNPSYTHKHINGCVCVCMLGGRGV